MKHIRTLSSEKKHAPVAATTHIEKVLHCDVASRKCMPTKREVQDEV